MLRTGQTSLAIGIRHGRQITTDEFKVRAELDVIGSHLEHAQMQICDGRERATGHKQQRGLLRVIHLALETKFWEIVVAHGSRRDVRRLLVHIVTLPADHFRRYRHRRRAVDLEGGVKWFSRVGGLNKTGRCRSREEARWIREDGGRKAQGRLRGDFFGEVGRRMERRGGARSENSPGGGGLRGGANREAEENAPEQMEVKKKKGWLPVKGSLYVVKEDTRS